MQVRPGTAFRLWETIRARMSSSLFALQPINQQSETTSVDVTMVVSLVSHGHGECVQRLLHQIAGLSAHIVRRVVLTLNIPEDEPAPPAGGWPFILEVRRNLHPRGFGVNHNLALAGAVEAFVCVLNPDVQLLEEPFSPLAAVATVGAAGADKALSYPVQVDLQGRIQQSERELPTPMTLLRRRLLGRSESRVDWVNAACIVLAQEVWQEITGVNENYYMYCEDVDLCLRLRLSGVNLVKVPIQIVHIGARASGSNLRHLVWHLSSLCRLWRSSAYKDVRRSLAVKPHQAK